MADEEETQGISDERFEELVGAIEDVADAFKKRAETPSPEIKPVINVPQSPAPVMPTPQVTVKPQLTGPPPADHPYAKGMRIIPERDGRGNATEYRVLPL